MAISDVQLKNKYYQVFDSSGKKIEETHETNVGELCGFSSDFMVFKKNKYYATYDENFKKIKEIHETNVGEFRVASGSTVTFCKNKYTATYDKFFKKISERYTGWTFKHTITKL